MSDFVRSFESAYPGSMFPRDDGSYVERNDHKSMAAALVELIASRDRELEDLRERVVADKAEIERLTAQLAEAKQRHYEEAAKICETQKVNILSYFELNEGVDDCVKAIHAAAKGEL